MSNFNGVDAFGSFFSTSFKRLIPFRIIGHCENRPGNITCIYKITNQTRKTLRIKIENHFLNEVS